MVEIEIGVLRGQCVDRRIGERDPAAAKCRGRTHQTDVHHRDSARQNGPRLPGIDRRFEGVNRCFEGVISPVQRYY